MKKEQYQKLSEYLRGTAKALELLSGEIDNDKSFSKESEELMSKIGSNLLFHAKSYTFLAPNQLRDKR